MLLSYPFLRNFELDLQVILEEKRTVVVRIEIQVILEDLGGGGEEGRYNGEIEGNNRYIISQS